MTYLDLSLKVQIEPTLHHELGSDAVFLRRNNQIQDAIDSQNMKQALQLIEKRMKKGENTPFLKVRLPSPAPAILPRGRLVGPINT